MAPPCRIVADQNGPYPACCPRVECPPLNVNINEIPDDQIAMGSYDVTLEDNQVRFFFKFLKLVFYNTQSGEQHLKYISSHDRIFVGN